MHKHIWLASLFLTLAALWVANADPESSQPDPATTGTAQLVRAQATANAPDRGGRQMVRVVVDIQPDWHIYANAIGNNTLRGAETKLVLSAPRGLRDQRITYPPGRRIRDPKQGDYNVYEGQAVIEAVVFRQPGDATPLEAELRFQVCSKSQGRCVPGRIRLKLQ
ncbi:MAG: protein-disulfide reductase DsbD N-terminal domain-containing protein [Gemmataceae bacterium]